MKERAYYILLPIIAAIIIGGWIWGPGIRDSLRQRYDQLTRDKETVGNVLYFVAVIEPYWESETIKIVPSLPPENNDRARVILVVADQAGRLRYLLIVFPNINIPDFPNTHFFLINVIEIDKRGQPLFSDPQEFSGHLLRWQNDQKCWVELPYAAQPTADGITCQSS